MCEGESLTQCTADGNSVTQVRKRLEMAARKQDCEMCNDSWGPVYKVRYLLTGKTYLKDEAHCSQMPPHLAQSSTMESNDRKRSVETREWCQASFSVVLTRTLTKLEVSIFQLHWLAWSANECPVFIALPLGLKMSLFPDFMWVSGPELRSFCMSKHVTHTVIFFQPQKNFLTKFETSLIHGTEVDFFSPGKYLIPKKKRWGQGNFTKNCPQSPWAWNLWRKQQQTSW